MIDRTIGTSRILYAFGVLALLVAGCRGGEKKQEAVAASSAAAKAAAVTLSKKVLLVQSYHAEYPWVAAINRGVTAKLNAAGIPFEIFYMDTKRKTDEAWKKESGQLAQKKVTEYQPGAIIAADDNAQQFFGRMLVDGPIPLVFCGVNHDPTRYGYPARNVTGVIERPNLKQTLGLMARIRAIKRFALISDDDPTSVGTLNHLKQGNYDATLVETRNIGTFDDWKKAVNEFNGKVDALGIFNYHTLKRAGETQSMNPKEVMAWTSEHLTIPSMGFQDFTIQDGALLGTAESGDEQGDKAADYAIRLMNGAAASILPVVQGEQGVMMLNRSTAERLKIKIDESKLGDVKVVALETKPNKP